MPHGNVDEDATRTRLGRGLNVCGPLIFAGQGKDGGLALSVKIEVVVVSSAEGLPIGLAMPNAVFYDDGTEDQEWMVAVPHFPPGVFDAGPARVTVFALVQLTPPHPNAIERWSEPVTIA